MKKINLINNPFSQFCINLGFAPTTYSEALTYEEQIMWLISFIEKQLIPAVQDDQDAIIELQVLYEELESYVDNYFDNLDVQQEINNKLDDMAQSGELADIIAQYIQLAGVLAYDTVSDMKTATNLVNGSTCQTLGYNTINDGGNAQYKVRTITNLDVVDDMFIIALADENLVAELIVDSPLNVLQLGVKNDGTTDCSDKINSATQKYDLFFPEGRYLVENEISLYHSIFGENFQRGGLKDVTNGSIIISNITCSFTDKEEVGVFNINNSLHGFNIKNISIKLKEYECGIKGTGLSTNNIFLNNVNVTNIKSTGILLSGSKSKIPELNNIFLVGTGESFEDSTGININFSDYKIINLDVMACRKGATCGGFVQGDNFHIWCGSIQDGDGILNHTVNESWFKGTVGIKVNYCLLNNIYLDTCYDKINYTGTNNSNTKMINNLVTLDDSSMDSVDGLAGRLSNTGLVINNHVNYITPVNKTNAFSDDINYSNESVVLNISENDYFAQNKVGGTKFYDVRYKFTKNVSGTSNNLIEIAKIKVEDNVAGFVELNVLHVRNRIHSLKLKFLNGAYNSCVIDNNGQTDEKFYITSSKDGNNIYKLYLKVNNLSDEYISVGGNYNYKWSGVNMIDLGYRTYDNHTFNPEAISSTSGLTELS